MGASSSHCENFAVALECRICSVRSARRPAVPGGSGVGQLPGPQAGGHAAPRPRPLPHQLAVQVSCDWSSRGELCSDWLSRMRDGMSVGEAVRSSWDDFRVLAWQVNSLFILYNRL